MKLGYKVHVYTDYYFCTFTEQYYLSSKMKVIDKFRRKRKVTVRTRRETILTLESLELFTSAVDLYTEARNIYFQGLPAKNPVAWAEFPVDSLHFPQCFSQFINKFLKF